MKINLKRMRDNFKSDIILTVLKEAIVNSIQANAKNIQVKIDYKTTLSEDQEIDKISIIDNGDGFNKENIDSFCSYGSDLKLNMGCKGIGRISYLKFFKEIKIESYIKYEGKQVNINFNVDFNKETCVEENVKKDIQENKTIILFDKMFDSVKSAQKIQPIKKIRDELYDQLLPLLYLKKDENSLIEIVLNNEEVINNKNLIFEKKEFEMKDTCQKDQKFILHYFLENKEEKKGILKGFYCANHHTVCRFKEKKLCINPIDNYSSVFLLESSFFDDKVYDERNDFNISPFQKENLRFGDLSWEDINQALELAIEEILFTKFPDLVNKNKNIIKNLKNNYLYLADYIEEINLLGGLIQEETIIRKAEDKFIKDKREFRTELKESTSNEEVLKKASDLAGKELIEYVLRRSKIIEQMEKISQEKEKKEEIFHETIMSMQSSSSQDDKKFINIKDNHIWLIDDKFMSYSYAASDKMIKEIYTNISEEDGSKELQNSKSRPDIAVFFQNKADGNNAVIIEFKALSATNKEKHGGLLQLRGYAKKLKKIEELENIWYYLITNIDGEFKDILTEDGYKPLFSTHDKVYFQYYGMLNVYLYIMSEESLIADAKARK